MPSRKAPAQGGFLRTGRTKAKTPTEGKTSRKIDRGDDHAREGVGYRHPIGANMSRRRGIPGLSFSWKRALGVSQAQAKLSRQIGIPLSRSGRQRKVSMSLGCCLATLLDFRGNVQCVQLQTDHAFALGPDPDCSLNQ